MDNITHIVLTRFNVRVRAKWSTQNNNPDWLGPRFELFKRYCLPSIQRQAEGRFRWLVYFDSHTPEPFLSRARTLLGSIPQARLVTIDIFDRELWIEPIRHAIEPDARTVITTRLDNDDALHPEFLARVRAAASRTESPRFLNLTRGLVLHGDRLYEVRDRSNAFLSLVERPESVETVWVKPHTEAASHAPVVQVHAPPSWLQIIHGSNVSNRVRGRRIRAAALQEFGLPAETRESGLAILSDNLSRYPARVARDALLGVGRRLRRMAR